MTRLRRLASSVRRLSDVARTMTQRQQEGQKLDAMARELAASGDYRVLRRLVPSPVMPPAARGELEKIGIVIDLETTGLDHTKDEVIELAMVKFSYGVTGDVAGVHAVFQEFNEASVPIPSRITRLTGITDAMVAGRKIDCAAVETFVADADLVIAHHAGFDRRFAERAWPLFAHKAWACSATEVDWQEYGFSGAKLIYLAAEAGFFYGAHRAVDDCHAVLELLGRPLPAISTTALSVLIHRAQRRTFRIWAEHSPYDLKDVLKVRGYRWSDGAGGSLRSWYIDVDECDRDAELTFLRAEIYQRNVPLRCVALSAFERFSERAGPRYAQPASWPKVESVR